MNGAGEVQTSFSATLASDRPETVSDSPSVVANAMFDGEERPFVSCSACTRNWYAVPGSRAPTVTDVAPSPRRAPQYPQRSTDAFL